MKIPKPIEKLIESFEKLPGIGPKTAQRLAFYLLHVPQYELDNFSDAVKNVKINTKICSICKNIGENNPCEICLDEKRNKNVICVVESPLDVLAIEKTNFNGLYHVLHGTINPLQNIGPEDLFINSLIKRLERHKIKEVIIATNPTMEGETTAFYITKLIKKLPNAIKITRIGRGLPTGADLEYADEITLKRALEGRTKI